MRLIDVQFHGSGGTLRLDPPGHLQIAHSVLGVLEADGRIDIPEQGYPNQIVPSAK